MKKLADIVITLCLLLLGFGFWLSGGDAFVRMMAGAVPLGEGESFEQAQGKYLSYEALYPAASRVEEYYSGDLDREKTVGYVVYDEERQAFLYVILPAENDTRMDNQMRNLRLAVEMRAGKGMEPFHVEGSLERMEASDVRHVMDALKNSELVELYETVKSEGEDSAYYQSYYGDSYGQAMETMCKAVLEPGWQQENWYYIEADSVGGLKNHTIWLTMAAMAMSLILFVCRLVSLFTTGREKPHRETPGGGSLMGHFFQAQWQWIDDWCSFSLNHARRLAYLSGAGFIVVLTGIGIAVCNTMEEVMALHVPLGVLLGEIAAVLFWTARKGQSKPEKIMARLEKSLEKELPSPADRERFAEDFLNASEWSFKEQGEDFMLCGFVGEHYWGAFTGTGGAAVVDAARVRKIETAKVSGQIRSGKVRVNYVSYAIRFFYQDGNAKNVCDQSLSFRTDDGSGLFMMLVRKRAGDSVEFVSTW